MYDHTFKYKQVQISRSDIRPHIKWAVSLVILHMVTSIFLRALCGYVWVNILTLSPRGFTVMDIIHWKNSCSDSRQLTVPGLKDIPLRGAEYKTLCSGVGGHPGDYRGPRSIFRNFYGCVHEHTINYHLSLASRTWL